MNKKPRNLADAVNLDSVARDRMAPMPRQSPDSSQAADSIQRAASSNSALSKILKAALGRSAAPKDSARKYKEYVDCSFGTIQG